jgi:hypothetical protein
MMLTFCLGENLRGSVGSSARSSTVGRRCPRLESEPLGPRLRCSKNTVLNPDKIRQPTSNQFLPFASRDRPLFAEVCKTLGTPLVNQASAFIKATHARYSAP